MVAGAWGTVNAASTARAEAAKAGQSGWGQGASQALAPPTRSRGRGRHPSVSNTRLDISARIVGKDATLARFPNRGALWDEVAPGLRALAVGSCVIFYQPFPEGIEVARVLRGARNLRRRFGNGSRLSAWPSDG